MKKKRVIPVVLLQNGFIVKSKLFSRHQRLGNPVTSVKRLSEWGSDELIYLDITKNGHYDLNRDDLAFKNSRSILDIIKDVSSLTLMPITVGGGIKTLNDIEMRLSAGADKIAINKIALDNPDFINKAAREFGSQCIVVSIDYFTNDGACIIYDHLSKKTLNKSLESWVSEVVDLGAGEILLNAVQRDGMQNGYDIETLQNISELVSIPIVACGGVGDWKHFAEALDQTKIDGVAAANIFHYSDQSVYLAKKYLYDHNMNVRYPEILKIEKVRSMSHAIL